MDIALREFGPADLPALDGWCRDIGSGEFMTNTRPRQCDFDGRPREFALLWKVITVAGQDAGAVWMEEAENRAEAVLGILLGRTDLFGRGIGRAALRLALDEARTLFQFRRVVLHVRKTNGRAIACYEACGFRTKTEGVKPKPGGGLIPFLTMEYFL